MNRTRSWEIFVFALLLAGFGLGMLELFWQGSSTGESYPPYSTLRADPLGGKILFDALTHTKVRRVARIFDDLARLPSGQSTSLILAGASTSSDPRSLLEAIERFCAEGGRLIIAFFPEMAEVAAAVGPAKISATKNATCPTKPKKRRELAKTKKMAKSGVKPRRAKLAGTDDAADAKPAGSADLAEAETAGSADADEVDSAESAEATGPDAFISIEDRWNFRYHHFDASTMKKPGLIAERLVDAKELPDHFSWHSALTFEPSGREWQTLYQVRGQPAVISRPWGQGAIVLLGDAFLLSNEAMLRERQPALLSWLFGDSGTLLFDETHLGLRRSGSVMSLIHQLRLTPLVVLLLLLGGLFAWKNSQSLVPVPAVSRLRKHSASGLDASAGLISLLRRGVSPQDILKVCLEEWQRIGQFNTPRWQRQKERLAEIVAEEQGRPAGKRNNVHAYNQMSTVINERK